MKKLLSIISIVFLLLAISLPASAAIKLEPRWTNTLQAKANISLDSKVYTADIIGSNGVNKISCTMILYKKGLFGILTEVSRYSDESNRASGFFSSPFTYASGTTYKLEATAVVYKNGVSETVTAYSEKTA